MPKKILFIVQGEGRGHLTQAIAYKDLLEKNGEQVFTIVGISIYRKLPTYFLEKMKPVLFFESPNFIKDNSKKGIRLMSSVLRSLLRSATFIKSIQKIHRKIKELQPDVIINFFEPLFGIYSLFNKPKTPVICVGHQMLLLHSQFKFPKEYFLQREGLVMLAKITSAGADLRMALSFYELEEDENKKIKVVPPLLRSEVYAAQSRKEEYFLVYLLNEGYIEELIKWHSKHPEYVLHCFTDNESGLQNEHYKNFYFHSLNDKSFLSYMKNCLAFITTAGFESVCEAMYLDKPIYMVPVKGHVEQYINSRDAAFAGAGMYGEDFNLSDFIDFVENKSTNTNFKNWANQSDKIILDATYQLLNK